MPLTSGKMPLDKERKIKKNLIALKKDMDARDLLDFFVQEEIFDFPDIDKVNGYNPNTTENRNKCFFSLLFQSGVRAYDVFLGALRENHQGYLAELIENTQVDDGQAQEEPHSWINTLPQNIRFRTLTEKDISRFAQTLGSDWQMVAYDLGLSKVEVDHCMMENQTPVMQIYSALNKWRTRNLESCTLNNFVQIVKDCQATSVDWKQMERIARGMQ